MVCVMKKDKKRGYVRQFTVADAILELITIIGFTISATLWFASGVFWIGVIQALVVLLCSLLMISKIYDVIKGVQNV